MDCASHAGLPGPQVEATFANLNGAGYALLLLSPSHISVQHFIRRIVLAINYDLGDEHCVRWSRALLAEDWTDRRVPL